MIQAKIILISIVVFATISGAVGFRIYNKFLNSYCIRTTIDNTKCQESCTTTLDNSKFVAAGGRAQVTYCYTTKRVGVDCATLTCPVSTSFTDD